MRRVVLIVCSFLLLVSVAAVAIYRQGGPEARKTGLELYSHRYSVVQRLRTTVLPPPVVWLGDSTTMNVPGILAYPTLIGEQVLAPVHEANLSIAAPGMDFYSYWSVAGRVAALNPKVVILVANLRTFIPAGGVRGMSDVMSEIDAADLPRTMTLPYYVRGMNIPRVLLARALRSELGENVFFVYEGVRRNVGDAGLWNLLGPAERPESVEDQLFRFVRMNEQILVNFDRPIGLDNPLVGFAGATVARLARDGATVIVVVTPIPWERGLEEGHYEPGRVLGRVAMLRGVVERNGGRLIDLHRALTKPYFRDTDCHLTAEGMAEMVRLLGPDVRRAAAESRSPERLGRR